MSGQYTTLARATASPSIVWIIAGLIALGPLATDFYIPTLPTIGEHFSASMAEVQWTLSAYIAAVGCWQFLAGPFADRFGRLPVVLGGLATYCADALFCSLAPSLDALLAGRILQGIGVCSVLVGVRGVVRDVFAPQEGAQVLATAGTIMSVAPLLSPPLWAALLDWAGWRSVFVVLLGMSVFMTLVVATRMQETNRYQSQRSLHPAAVLGAYARVLDNRCFRAYALTWACSYGGLFAFVSGAAFVLTDVYGLAPAEVALAFSIKVCGYIAGTVVCRMLLVRRGLQGTVRIGAGLQVSAGILMLTLAVAGTGHVVELIVPMVLYVLAHGLLYPTAQAGLMSDFPADAGSAAALGGSAVNAGCQWRRTGRGSELRRHSIADGSGHLRHGCRLRLRRLWAGRSRRRHLALRRSIGDCAARSVRTRSRSRRRPEMTTARSHSGPLLRFTRGVLASLYFTLKLKREWQSAQKFCDGL